MGFRSLREGEEVEFDLVVSDDGKKKAFNVTGPGGAPPQVGLQRRRVPGAQLPGAAGSAPALACVGDVLCSGMAEGCCRRPAPEPRLTLKPPWPCALRRAAATRSR